MNTTRVTTTCALLFSLSLSPLAATAQAAESASSLPVLTDPAKPLDLSSASASVLAAPAVDPMWESWSVAATSAMAQRGRYRARRGGRHGSGGALLLGAVATITGAAVLAYANRPDCDMNRQLSGCGYGTKVAGTAVLTGGVVGLVVGATWR